MKTDTYPEFGWMKERFYPLVINDETCEFDFTIQPGSTVPQHFHKESDEHFQVLKGEVTFKVNGKTIVSKKGEKLTIPKMIPHSIHNMSNAEIKCHVSYQPVVDQSKFIQICMFLAKENPKDKNLLFKALYIANCLNYREFSTVQGGMKVAEKLMIGFFKLIAPLTKWNQLVRKYLRENLAPVVH